MYCRCKLFSLTQSQLGEFGLDANKNSTEIVPVLTLQCSALTSDPATRSYQSGWRFVKSEFQLLFFFVQHEIWWSKREMLSRQFGVKWFCWETVPGLLYCCLVNQLFWNWRIARAARAVSASLNLWTLGVVTITNCNNKLQQANQDH